MYQVAQVSLQTSPCECMPQTSNAKEHTYTAIFQGNMNDLFGSLKEKKQENEIKQSYVIKDLKMRDFPLDLNLITNINLIGYTVRLLWPAMWYPITQLLHWYLH